MSITALSNDKTNFVNNLTLASIATVEYEILTRNVIELMFF